MAPDADNDDAVVPEATSASTDFSSAALSDVWIPGTDTRDDTMPRTDRPWAPSDLVAPPAPVAPQRPHDETTRTDPAWNPAPVAPWHSGAAAAGERSPGGRGPGTGEDLVQLRDALSSYGDRLNHQIELQERLEHELSVARATATAHVDTIGRQAAQLDLAATENNRLRHELDTVHGENNRLRHQLDTAHGEITDLRQQLDTAHGEITDLRQQLDTAHGENDRLRHELDNAHGEIRRLHEVERRRHGRVVEIVEGSNRELIAAVRAEVPDADGALADHVASIPGEGSVVSPNDAEAEAPLLDGCIDDWTNTVVTDSPAASRLSDDGPTLATMRRWLRRPGAMFVIDGDGTTELAAPGADLNAAREWLTIAVAGLLGTEAPRAEIVFDGGRSGDLPMVADDGGPRVRLTPPGIGSAATIDRIVFDHAPIGPALAAYNPAPGAEGRRPALWVPVEILADLLTGRRRD